MHSPTLNQMYNHLICVAWPLNRGQRISILPRCEECDKYLAGKRVIETASMWLCKECHDREDRDVFYSEEYYQRAERQQMGICD